MGQILTILHLVLAIFAIGDIMSSLRGAVPRILWVICVVAIPILGSCFWFYIQYVVPRVRKKLKAEEAEHLERKRREKEIDP